MWSPRSGALGKKRRKEKYERTVHVNGENEVSVKILSGTNLSYCAIDRFESFTSLRKPHCRKIRSGYLRACTLHPDRVTVHKSTFEERGWYEGASDSLSADYYSLVKRGNFLSRIILLGICHLHRALFRIKFRSGIQWDCEDRRRW